MSQRMDKVNSEIQKIVAKVIDEELRSSEIEGLITVTKVNTAPDFSITKIFVSIFGAKDNNSVLRGLKKSSGYVRTRIAQSTSFRKTPEVVFLFDKSIEYGYKIDSILKDLDIKDINEDDNINLND